MGVLLRAALVLCFTLSSASLADVERFETAEEQLSHAGELRKRHRACAGQGRKAAREAAVEAYEAVHTFHPRARECAAEAYFRAGELQRVARLSKDALRLFKASVNVSSSSSVRARAMLECGHVQRYLRENKKALSAYEKVIRDKNIAPKYRDRATFWKARVFLLMQREEDARRVFRLLASTTDDPLMSIRAHDELALSAVREGDLEWAAGIVEQCRIALADPLREETNVGRRVRIAFRTMRCRVQLKNAIVKRRRTRTE